MGRTSRALHASQFGTGRGIPWEQRDGRRLDGGAAPRSLSLFSDFWQAELRSTGRGRELSRTCGTSGATASRAGQRCERRAPGCADLSDGLATVQGSFTVGIHSQVDGKLQALFKEGQRVNRAMCSRRDSRLYKAALDQAKAKKEQDQAPLEALQKDLVRFKRR